MGLINTGIRSIAEERAKDTAKIEKIYSEVEESVADSLVVQASFDIFSESSLDMMDDAELDELLNELPDDACDEKEEIGRMLLSEDNEIDIDDIIGVIDNAE
jgi:hypothetical protein